MLSWNSLAATDRINVLPCNVIHLDVTGKNVVRVLPSLIKGHPPHLSGMGQHQSKSS